MFWSIWTIIRNRTYTQSGGINKVGPFGPSSEIGLTQGLVELIKSAVIVINWFMFCKHVLKPLEGVFMKQVFYSDLIFITTVISKCSVHYVLKEFALLGILLQYNKVFSSYLLQSLCHVA